MKVKWMLVAAVWVAAFALFGTMQVKNVGASGQPEQKQVVPDVVGMTVEEGYQAYLDALAASGWLDHSGTNNVRYHVQPGNQDWQGTDMAKAIIVKQQPNARTSANWGTALCVWVAEVEPSPSPSPTVEPTPEPEPEPTEEPEPEPTDDSEPAAPKTQESEGSLSYTL